MYGKTHKESVEQVEAAAGEALHLWISKGTQNEIEMIVKEESEGKIPSLLINHQMPYFKEVAGICQAH